MEVKIAPKIINKSISNNIFNNIIDIIDSKEIQKKFYPLYFQISQGIVYLIFQEYLDYAFNQKPKRFK